MSFEKVKVRGIQEITSRKTGEQHHFLRVEVLKTYDIYMNDTAMALVETYKRLIGKEVLLPLEFGTYNGQASLNFTDDCKPVLMP